MHLDILTIASVSKRTGDKATQRSCGKSTDGAAQLSVSV